MCWRYMSEDGSLICIWGGERKWEKYIIVCAWMKIVYFCSEVTRGFCCWFLFMGGFGCWFLLLRVTCKIWTAERKSQNNFLEEILEFWGSNTMVWGTYKYFQLRVEKITIFFPASIQNPVLLLYHREGAFWSTEENMTGKNINVLFRN